eukprot:s2332_g4.t1
MKSCPRHVIDAIPPLQVIKGRPSCRTVFLCYCGNELIFSLIYRTEKGILDNEVPEKLRDELLEKLVGQLRTFAGKLTWAAGICKPARWGVITAHEAEVRDGTMEGPPQIMEELVLRTEGVGPLLLACLAWTACTFPPAARAATGHVGASLCSADCKHVVDPPKSPSQQTEGEAKARGQAEAIEIQNAGDIQEQGKGGHQRWWCQEGRP